jgi:hypothetical protein
MIVVSPSKIMTRNQKRFMYPSEARHRRVRALRSQDVVNCEWCGRGVEAGTLRKITVLRKQYMVCSSCPPPENSNAMRV